jgi:hypothetical protein
MKKISTLLLISVLLLGIKAEGQIAFSKEYGGAYNEDGRWMEQLPDSGYILTGRYNNFQQRTN